MRTQKARDHLEKLDVFQPVKLNEVTRACWKRWLMWLQAQLAPVKNHDNCRVSLMAGERLTPVYKRGKEAMISKLVSSPQSRERSWSTAWNLFPEIWV